MTKRMTKPEQSRRAALIDELGSLEDQLRPVKPALARAEALRKEVRGWLDAAPADSSGSFDGERYTVQVGARRHERRVLTAAAFKNLGKQKFLELCTFGVGLIEKLVPYPDVKEMLAEEQTGPRTVTVALRFLATRAAAKCS